jgi:hypothetical protein
MLDRFIERWLGPLLIASGGLGLLAACALALGWLAPPPTPPPGGGMRIILGPRGALYEQPDLVAAVASLCLVVGVHLTRHFRRERARSRVAG